MEERERALLNHDVQRWQDTDWTPEPESYPCSCGCEEMITWAGIGRRPKYKEGHRQKMYYRRKVSNFVKKE